MVRKSALVILTALIVAGCSSSGSSKATTTTLGGDAIVPTTGFVLNPRGGTTVKQTIDPCSLMTVEEASALVGTKVTHSTGGGTGSLFCSYAAGNLAGTTISVKIDRTEAEAHADFPTWVQPIQGKAAGLTISTVPNLGDEASETHTGTVNNGIYVRKGAALVKIGTYPPAKDEALKTAVRTAFSRI